MLSKLLPRAAVGFHPDAVLAAGRGQQLAAVKD